MKTRQTTISALAAHTAAGTTIIPIRVQDPISRLIIPFGVTVGANARLEHHVALFSKIEIVDGSDVLMSLSGLQADGICRLDHIGNAAMFSDCNRSAEAWGNIIIDFGRYLYDKQLAFVPTKYKNPQIQLTTSWTTVEAACTADEFEVLALIMEGLGSSPIGFLSKKELKSWVAASGAWEYTQLPKDYVYRRLFIQAKTKLVGVGAHWSRALLQEDNYKRIPFDTLIDDQVALNASEYGEITEGVGGSNVSSATYPVFAAPCYGASMPCNLSPDILAVGIAVQDGGYYNAISASGVNSWRGNVHGLVPQGMVAFELGPRDVIEDWYDPSQVGNLQLEVLGAGAHTIRLVTEQLRTN